MQNAKYKMQNAKYGDLAFCIEHFSFCNLHFRGRSSCQDSWNDFCASGDTGESFLAAVGVKRQLFVIQPECGEDRCMQIAERRRPVDCEIADFIGAADALSRFDSAACEPDCEAGRVVVSA